MLTNLIKTNPFEGKSIAVIGDVMVDRFIYGDVERISPEAPVPVVKVSKRETHLGGAANVAANIKSLGARPLLVGRIGHDEYGSVFKECALEIDIDNDYLFTSKQVPTTAKCRIIARSQQVVRFDEEVNAPLQQNEKEDVRKILEKVRKETDVIIVSDYAKGLVDADIMAVIKELWTDGHILLDPKPQSFEEDQKYIGVNAIKPNLQEACKMVGSKEKPREDSTVERIAKELVNRYKLDYMLLTRSGDGMTLALSTGEVHHLKSETREVIDVSGAGDTVIATFAASLTAGFTPLQAAHLANVSGSVIVAKLGTASIHWQELKDAVEHYVQLPYVKDA